MKNECLPQHPPCEATTCGFPHAPCKASRLHHDRSSGAKRCLRANPPGMASWLLDEHGEQMVTRLSLLEAAPLPRSVPTANSTVSPPRLPFPDGHPQGQGGPGSVDTLHRGDLVIGAHPAIFLIKRKKNQQLHKAKNKGGNEATGR